MSLGTPAGATLGITAMPPATFDAAGYSALAFTLVGEILSIGDFGREYAKAEFKPLRYRATGKHKGGYDDGSLGLRIGCDEADGGQAILEAAASNDANYYIQIIRLDSTVHYLPVQVMGFRRSIGDRDAIIMVMTTLEITQVNGVGIVTVRPVGGDAGLQTEDGFSFQTEDGNNILVE